MEIKMNKDVMQYTEAVYFGLSMRQFFCVVPALATSVLVYFKLRTVLPLEPLSWLCIGAAVPFAAIGFVKYQGQTAEQFLVAWIRYTFFMPKKLVYRSDNYYYKALCNQKYSSRQEDNTKNGNNTTKSISEG